MDKMFQCYYSNEIRVLGEILRRYAAIPDVEWLKFKSFLRETAISKNKHLLKPGQTSRRLSFVCRGLFRIYRAEENREINTNFFGELSFANSFTSFINQTPSDYGIQALEDARLVSVSYDAMQKLGAGHECWQKFALGAAVFKLSRLQDWEVALKKNSAEERYLNFAESCPQVVNRIPLRHLASYLGIAPPSLSRIRRGLLPQNRRSKPVSSARGSEFLNKC